MANVVAAVLPDWILLDAHASINGAKAGWVADKGE